MTSDLYPVLNAGFDVQTALETLPSILSLPRVTALRLPEHWNPEPEDLARLTDLLHANEVAMICEISGELTGLAKPLLENCDGLHLTTVDMLPVIRKVVGDNMQLGCACATRDDAMKAGESGADYVAFSTPEAGVLSWWVSVMELPAVADGISSTEQAAAAVAAGADFLAVPLKLDGKDKERLSVFGGT